MIDIQNMNDNECFKWCIVRYLHPADHHSTRIRKIDEVLPDELDFEDIKLPVKILKKKFKKNSIIQSIYQKHVMKTNMIFC